MARKKKREGSKWLDSEGLVDMKSRTDHSLTAVDVHDLIKMLDETEHDELMKMLTGDGGIRKMSAVTQDINTPGAIELLLDRVEYYHFFRPVQE